MADAPLLAHSLAEIHLYLRVAACSGCGKGPLRLSDTPGCVDEKTAPAKLSISCAACGANWSRTIELLHPRADEPLFDETTINPSGDPSRIIDLGQWLVLVSLLKDEASRETNKAQARELGMNAARCLDEALKFYTDEDNDLPPPEAFFDETSRKRFHNSPEQFSRRRIAGMMTNLPRPYPKR